MYTLYTIPGSCSTGIAVLMEKLKVEYTSIKRKDVENYATIVPTNQVPALKTEAGKIITEGGAIALYLLEKHGQNFLPSDSDQRADFYQWLNFAYATIHPSYSKIFAIKSQESIDEATKQKIMQNLADKLSGVWKIVDQHLEDRTFVLGEEPSHIDYMMTIYTSWNNYFPGTKVSLGQNINRLVENVTALPEFKAGYEAEGAEFKPAPSSS